ncbi:antitoxin [Streptomyces somaliensis]|nr:antitoxin [Streptomyces somaliensis]
MLKGHEGQVGKGVDEAGDHADRKTRGGTAVMSTPCRSRSRGGWAATAGGTGNPRPVPDPPLPGRAAVGGARGGRATRSRASACGLPTSGGESGRVPYSKERNMLRRVSIALAGLLAVGFLTASPAAADMKGCWIDGSYVQVGDAVAAELEGACWSFDD